MTEAPIGDLQVAYTEAGEGDPVVYLHGLAEAHESWKVQLDAIDGHRNVAYDLRGHGRTTAGEPDGTVAQLGHDLIGFVDAVIEQPATVVGFSMGGTVALWAAAHRPDLISNVVVLGTSSVVGRAAVGFYETRIEESRAPYSDAFVAAMRDDTRRGLAREPQDLDALTADRLRAVGTGEGYRNAATAMMRLRAEPLTPMLTELRVPVEVIAADEDTFCPAKASQILLESLPDARYQEIAGAGHLMNVDDPDAVTAALTNALNGRN